MYAQKRVRGDRVFRWFFYVKSHGKTRGWPTTTTTTQCVYTHRNLIEPFVYTKSLISVVISVVIFFSFFF